jgi:peptidoglycan hydrolase-like protein with peptidoglycan-binding domain
MLLKEKTMRRMVLIIIFVLFASHVIAKDSIELVYNFQRPGGDYTNFQAANAGECARKCEVSSRCQAFDFHKSDSSCWLKDRVYQTRPYQGVVSGAKNSRQPGKTRSLNTKMILSFGTHRPGGDYARFHTQNQQGCAEDCSKDPMCVAFDFTMVDSMCYMKNWEPPASPYQGVISGVKKRKSAVPQKNSGQIKSVQRVLAEQGYNPGPVDGMMGKKTRIALRHYQRDYDLPVTGRIDELTLTSLGTKQRTTTTTATPTAPVSVHKQVELSPTQTYTVSRDNIVNVAIFPWVLNGDSDSFISILKENINYRTRESNTFRLKKSYYKIKGIPKLNIADSWTYYMGDKPNIIMVQQIAQEHGIDVAVLGTMDIHCRWSDACQVRQMEIMLIDTQTGVITAVQGGSWDQEARDVIASHVSTVFNKFNSERHN